MCTRRKTIIAAFISSFLSKRGATVVALTHLQHCITSLPLFEGVGVTSIHAACIEGQKYQEMQFYSIHVGTKRGSLKRVTWSAPADPDIDIDDVEKRADDYLNMDIHDYADTNGFALKPYPIYSMIHIPKGKNHHHYNNEEGGGLCSTRPESILCGGGDRYITVWNNMENNIIQKPTRNGRIQDTWQIVNQLGPHTGWVKDMVSYSQSSTDTPLLFSIGCNCIEIWKMNCKHGSKSKSASPQWSWQHDSKLEIESSLEFGCTLSSDLLCLGVCNKSAKHRSTSPTDTESVYLFAGGVDGRLHRWTLTLDGSLKNAEHRSAHQGRVNEILVCEEFNVLASIGSDGVLLCKSMRDGPFEEWTGVSLDINQAIIGAACMEKSSDFTVKVTSVCCLRENDKEAILVVGCSSGLAVPVELTRLDGVLNLKVLQESVMKFEKECTIHALEVIHRITRSKNGRIHAYYYLIAGTSEGLSIGSLIMKNHPVMEK